MRTEAINISVEETLAEGNDSLSGSDYSSVLLGLFLTLSLFISVAIISSPVVLSIIGIITVLPILQVLISGIINLNLIIS